MANNNVMNLAALRSNNIMNSVKAATDNLKNQVKSFTSQVSQYDSYLQGLEDFLNQTFYGDSDNLIRKGYEEACEIIEQSKEVITASVSFDLFELINCLLPGEKDGKKIQYKKNSASSLSFQNLTNLKKVIDELRGHIEPYLNDENISKEMKSQIKSIDEMLDNTNKFMDGITANDFNETVGAVAGIMKKDTFRTMFDNRDDKIKTDEFFRNRAKIYAYIKAMHAEKSIYGALGSTFERFLRMAINDYYNQFKDQTEQRILAPISYVSGDKYVSRGKAGEITFEYQKSEDLFEGKLNKTYLLANNNKEFNMNGVKIETSFNGTKEKKAKADVVVHLDSALNYTIDPSLGFSAKRWTSNRYRSMGETDITAALQRLLGNDTMQNYAISLIYRKAPEVFAGQELAKLSLIIDIVSGLSQNSYKASYLIIDNQAQQNGSENKKIEVHSIPSLINEYINKNTSLLKVNDFPYGLNRIAYNLTSRRQIGQTPGRTNNYLGNMLTYLQKQKIRVSIGEK